MFRFRIIPATIVTASLLLAVKVVDVVRGTETLSDALLVPSVDAQTSGTAAPSAASAAQSPASSSAPSATKPPDPGAIKKAAEEGVSTASAGDAGKNKNPNVSDEPGSTVDQHYSAVEVELLENLARRRDELDHWQQNIQIKEAMLDATEKRIDQKVQQIEAMKQQVSDLLAQYNEKEDAKIHSLVKIYENMKPKDAARIFDEVQMPILLLVIDKMSEKKAAPILAAMDPSRAKDITVQLAEERRIHSAKLAPVAAAVAPPAASPAAAAPAPNAGQK